MKKLNRNQYMLVYLTAFLLTIVPSVQFIERFLPEDGWQSFTAPLLVMMLITFIIQAILAPFREPWDKDEVAVPMGWKAVLYLYVLWLAITYLFYTEADSTPLFTFGLPLLVTVLFVIFDRLAVNYANFTRERRQMAATKNAAQDRNQQS